MSTRGASEGGAARRRRGAPPGGAERGRAQLERAQRQRQVHEAGLLGRWAKACAPALAAAVGSRTAVRFAETYLAILQGKGAGTGWDLAGEARAAAAFLAGAPAPVVLDVGANYGQWAVAVDRAVGPGTARFFLCEPQEACQPALRALPLRAVLVPAAVSDRPGRAVLRTPGPGAGTASLFERRDSYLPPATRTDLVAVTTVDGLLAEHGLDRVDLLKLDIEGGELDGLRGAGAALAAGRIAAVAFEFGSANVYSRTFFRDIWDLLQPLGFRLWRIAPGGRLLPVPAYREELEHFRGVSNYLAALSSPS
jgi:FkbM family methyltransferase